MYCQQCEKDTKHEVDVQDIDRRNAIEESNGDHVRTYSCKECHYSFDDL